MPHRYNFTVYALNVDTLNLPANATASFADFMLTSHAMPCHCHCHAIAIASLTARYGR